MFFDPQSLPATGATLMAAALYAGISLFGTGPLVGERMILKSGWAERCPTVIEQAVRLDTDASPMAAVDCGMVVGLFAPDLGELCRPVDRIIDEIERRPRELDARRLDYATAGAASRCDCAAAVALEENRIALAMHAGSLRLITPHGVKTLQSRLDRALASPICAAKE